jgi:hypothetical protein
MPKIFKNFSDTVETAIFVTIGLIALAGIIRFIVLSDLF